MIHALKYQKRKKSEEKEKLNRCFVLGASELDWRQRSGECGSRSVARRSVGASQGSLQSSDVRSKRRQIKFIKTFHSVFIFVPPLFCFSSTCSEITFDFHAERKFQIKKVQTVQMVLWKLQQTMLDKESYRRCHLH